MKLWEWILAGGLGLFFLYLLLKSKSTSTVIIDGSTGSSSQGSLNSVLDGVAFGSSLITPLSNLFGGGSSTSSSSTSSFTSTGGVLVGGGSSYGPSPIASSSGISSTGLADSDDSQDYSEF